MTRFSTIQYAILVNEMNLYREYMAGFGVIRGEMLVVKPSFYNRTYTANMLAAGETDGLAEVLTAVFPCARSYADYAKRLKKQYAENLEGSFYRTWIENYTGCEFSEFF